MAALADAFHYEREAQIARNENALAASLPPINLEPLTEVETALLAGFIRWADSRGVRHLPARPSTIAAWVLQHPPGVWGEEALRETFVITLGAIERAHELCSLANPVATALVRGIVSSITKVEPPRSWTKEEKLVFATQITPPVQAIIARRERDRERELRRMQNELAEAKRKNGDAEKVIDNLKKEIKVMPTKEGPYSDAKKALKDMVQGKEFDPRSKSIATRVEDAAKENDGFSGGIPNKSGK